MTEKTIYIIAGEASGDIYGGKIIHALRKQYQGDLRFEGIGGREMEEQGFLSLFPMKELSIMGFLEVLPRIPKMMRRIRQTIRHIKQIKPDVILTIDSPGFNFRVAKKLQGSSIPIIHMVAPTVWAYKPERADKMAKFYDQLLLILPFEAPYFAHTGLQTTYIGHPITEFPYKDADGESFRKAHQISDDTKVLTILPGSRKNEIKHILPAFLDTAEIMPKLIENLHIVFAVHPLTAGAIRMALQDAPFRYSVVEDVEEKHRAYAASDAALAKSGTGTLEIALHKIPMVIGYRANSITYKMIYRIINITYVNILNLILNRPVIPELLQDACEVKTIMHQLYPLMAYDAVAKAQVDAYTPALEALHAPDNQIPSELAAQEIMKRL